MSAQLRRRLLTMHPPMPVDTFCRLLAVVEAQFPGAAVEYGDLPEGFHIIVTEDLDDNDQRLITVPERTGPELAEERYAGELRDMNPMGS